IFSRDWSSDVCSSDLLTVVTFLGFFDKLQIFGQFRSLRESHPINTGQLLTRLITSPISTCHIGQFYRFDKSCIRDMWSTTQVSRSEERRVGVAGMSRR